ncbi:MAG: FKBP-type peptidyl-prolyl cis-trans isomerase [Candidatus Methylophosphatis roskildensis]
MKHIVAALFVALVNASAVAADMSEEQKTFYALGQIMARQMNVFSMTPTELGFVKQGMTDAVDSKKPAIDMDVYGPKVQALAQTRRAANAEKLAKAGAEFTDKAAKEKGAVKTSSGLVYIPLSEGTGGTPTADDKVKVHYTGTLVDGTEFDSSNKRGSPAEFPLGQVIKCWTEGLQKMKVGGKARLVCPPAIAYGDNGTGPIPPKATLNFEVELLDIVKNTSAAPAGAAAPESGSARPAPR